MDHEVNTEADEPKLNFYLKDEEFEEPPEDIYYLLAANGLFKITKTFAFRASTQTFTPLPDKNLDSLKEHEKNLQLCLPKKISRQVLKDAVKFFRKIWRDQGSESVGLIYWEEAAGDYKLVIPEQKAHMLNVTALVGPNPEGMLRLGTIHSHGIFKAGHSGTDDADERYDDGLHITVGDVLKMKPSISCSVVIDGTRFLVPVTEVFAFDSEGLKTRAVPKGWLEKVNREKKTKKAGS